MTGLCFVDANVFVYARDARDPHKHKRAADWIDLLWREQRGRTSAQALLEFYAVATRKLTPRVPSELAWRDVERYLGWRPRATDEELLRRARSLEERHRLSWWDSMIVAAAQLQNCEVLLTEDLHDGAAFGPLVVRSPFTLRVEQRTAAYEVRPALASLHRPRGRPRRTALA
jgi:predicted nucleic acid-binding protein